MILSSATDLSQIGHLSKKLQAMRLVITLLGVLLVAKSFAQQKGANPVSDSLSNDKMPIHKDNGTAADIPTRKGQGDSVDMPLYKGNDIPKDLPNTDWIKLLRISPEELEKLRAASLDTANRKSSGRKDRKP